MKLRRPIISVVVLAAALAGCTREGELVVSQGVGVTAVRTACPAVGIPDYTGDVTTFRTANAVTADQIDVVAAITNLRSSCNETGENVYSEAKFDVLARRTDTRGARQVQLPYFSTVLQGGSAVQAKRVGTITLNFADGQERAQATGTAGAFVNRAAATLPDDIKERITRRRKAGDPDAALDPLADPVVRAALNRATFELLVGFQLSENQLAYNVTR
ncbi:hypothetical protein QWY75_07590 [Pontixanthobacter aestiaquae]|uniref:Lipoprotein n=1 Tax=Pontixanthobacter aestiaquae TaxID=1509367 RepID=A0A844Z6J4_9SPHN|nr:hypothetical protein [Pontixanthobacter aestiaquae]MDN3646066.1 hypothetical protein [Pontixanthobacter aestiaquae]MXO82942.1 hypothetical protein [Pontixanthobacter aestiaquae]